MSICTQEGIEYNPLEQVWTTLACCSCNNTNYLADLQQILVVEWSALCDQTHEDELPKYCTYDSHTLLDPLACWLKKLVNCCHVLCLQTASIHSSSWHKPSSISFCHCILYIFCIFLYVYFLMAVTHILNISTPKSHCSCKLSQLQNKSVF